MDEDTAGIMVTNPNTLGLFEDNIKEVSAVVHAKGGLVYADGANMNAIMGIVDMAACGVDVLHFNLHKTFSTPHGGGGPGSGPVCVTAELAQFLPVPRVVKERERYRSGRRLSGINRQIARVLRQFCNSAKSLRLYSVHGRRTEESEPMRGAERQLHQGKSEGHF